MLKRILVNQMPVYSVNYSSVNTYDPAIRGAVLEYLIFPLESLNQKVINLEIDINPETPFYYSKNFYGFDILRCRLKKDFKKFELIMNASIEKYNSNPFASNWLPVEQEREMIESTDFYLENYYFLSNGKYTTKDVEIEFPTITGLEQIFDFAQRVNDFVYDYITYDNDFSSIDNTLKDIMNNHKGVCQDFAHLMIAILRANKIPARYVSGYLNQGSEFEGSSAIHAWVEVMIPGVGWLGFDPTNNLLEDHHFIKIAHGVDYSECTSLKGVIKAKGNNTTEYDVKITEQINNTDQ